MVEEELQELKFAFSQGSLAALVRSILPAGSSHNPWSSQMRTYHRSSRLVVSGHLGFDAHQVHLRRLARDGLEVGDVVPDTVQDPPLELEEIAIDAQPVAGVFPLGGLEVSPSNGPVANTLGGAAIGP
jgi:hypothetical protein